MCYFFPMRLEDSLTKDRIIMLLKKAGGMTAEDLSRQIGITPMGVRQHLLSLERKGMVEYEARKHGIGRPVFIYKLTDKADDIFPKSYGRFALDMLNDIEELDGREKVTELFRMRKEKLFKERSAALGGIQDFNEKVRTLTKMLEGEGYLIELKENGREDMLLNQFNCPVSRVASQYNEACRYELELLNDLLGRSIQRKGCMAAGDPVCSFLIPSVKA